MALKLQNRLQESYHAYQDTIADIERITKQIASKLDLDRAIEVRTEENASDTQDAMIYLRVFVATLSTLLAHLPLHCTHIPAVKTQRPRGTSGCQS